MKTHNANDLGLLAEEIKRRPLLTQYLTPAAKRGYICICGNGSGEHGTGANVSKDGNRLLCGKCQSGYSNIDIIANHLGISTNGKDFIEVVKFGCQEFGLPFIDETPTTPTENKKFEKVTKVEKVEPFDRLEEAQKNLADFIKNQGGKWRGLSLETLQHNKCGYLPNVYFPAAGKELPAVVIPNDLGGVYFRAIQGKFHKNSKPMATTTVFLPDSEEFDLFVTEGQVNALSILQAVPNPSFGVMACSGTSGENNILAKLQELTYQGKKFRVVLAFDKDSNGAGQNAAKKIVKTLTEAGYTVCSITDDLTVTDMDLNDILTQGGEKLLGNFMNVAVDLANAEFTKIAQEENIKLFGNSSANYFSSIFQSDVDTNRKFENRKTGFENLDNEINYFLPGVYIVGGLPALGKTTFALQLLDQMARQGNHCIYVSYEMVQCFLYSKLLAREVARIETNDYSKQVGGIDYDTGKEIYRLTSTQISLGRINSFHKDAYLEALNNFKNDQKQLYIWEENQIDIDNLLERIKKICLQLDEPPIVCIDYLQLLTAGSDNTKTALDEVLHKIFNFRRETNTTFIIISSLNRANYQTEISFESFKESGSIEYSADAIWGLQLLLDKRTPSDAEKAKKEIPRQIQLKCLKNRFGANFDIGFYYYPNCDTFIPMLEYGTYTDYKSSNNHKGDDDNEKNSGSF